MNAASTTTSLGPEHALRLSETGLICDRAAAGEEIEKVSGHRIVRAKPQPSRGIPTTYILIEGDKAIARVSPGRKWRAALADLRQIARDRAADAEYLLRLVEEKIPAAEPYARRAHDNLVDACAHENIGGVGRATFYTRRDEQWVVETCHDCEHRRHRFLGKLESA